MTVTGNAQRRYGTLVAINRCPCCYWQWGTSWTERFSYESATKPSVIVKTYGKSIYTLPDAYPGL